MLGKRRGFTLVELLVVISIISLLSSIVLGSLASARTKAKNSLTTSEMIQYRNALELYYSDHGTYPVVEDSAPHCLGYSYPSNQCGFSTLSPFTNSDMLNTALRPYISGLPTINVTPIVVDVITNNNIVGAFYACTNSGGRCSSAAVMWAVAGSGQSCGLGNSTSQSYGNSTVCSLNLIGQLSFPSP